MQPEEDAVPAAMQAGQSGASEWPLLARFIEREARLADVGRAAAPATLFVYEFVRFGVKQAWACLFGALMLALIIATWALYPKGALARALRFPRAGGDRDPERDAVGAARDAGRRRGSSSCSTSSAR